MQVVTLSEISHVIGAEHKITLLEFYTMPFCRRWWQTFQ